MRSARLAASVRAAALAGLGFAVLPEVGIREALNDGQLIRLGVQPKHRTISAIRRKSTKLPAVEAFWSVLPGLPPSR